MIRNSVNLTTVALVGFLASEAFAQAIDPGQLSEDVTALRLWRIPSALKHCKHGLTEKQAAAAIVVVVKGAKSTLKGVEDAGRSFFEMDFAKDPKGACAYALPKDFLQYIRTTVK